MCVLMSHSRSVMGGSLIMTVPGLEVYSQTQKKRNDWLQTLF